MQPFYRKIIWRLVPFLMLLYTVAFLDRVNISFAALTMNRDLGFSETVYGLAAGVFFFSYCLFQVPANMVLARMGARRWLGLLMILWGIDCMATAFVAGEPSYITARLLLGIAESGFYPGVIYYLTFWMPRPARTRVLALFLLSMPLCNAIGSPISAHILLMDQVAGLRGWQWLFLLEGAPAVLLGFATWFVLADNPRSAHWLSEAEKNQLAADMKAGEPPEQPEGASRSWGRVVRDSAVYFMWSTGNYGLIFFLPKILVMRGASTLATGWWATLTFGVGAIAMLIASRARTFRSLPLLFVIAAVGFAAAASIKALPVAVAGCSIAACGIMASLPIFWSAASSRFSGKAAGTAIAIVNSVGAMGAGLGPYVMGWLRDLTHGYSTGLWVVAGCLAVGAVLTVGAGAAAQTQSPR